MTISPFTYVEPLESRIAPAGLVTATFLNGLLTITGADDANHDIEIVKTGPDTFRVEGNATDVNRMGKTFKNFQGTLTDVLIEGGAGTDTFEVSNLSPLHRLGFNGNAGVDSLSTVNLQITEGGRVDIDLGSETGSVNFFGDETTIHGHLNIDLGGGGTAGFRSTLTTVDTHVEITGGPGSDAVSITGDTTLFKFKLKFDGGGGADSFTASGSSFHVRGAIAMDGGGGTNLFNFTADHNKFGARLAPSLVDIKVGVGPGAVTFLGDTTDIFGDLTIDLGSGGGIARLHSTTTDVTQNVSITGGAGGDTVKTRGSTSIGGDFTFLGSGGDDAFRGTGSLFAVTGATSMDGGTGAAIFDLDVSSLTLAGLTFTGGTSNDTVSISADGNITGDANLQLGLDGTGPSSTILKSRAGVANGLKFGGSLTIDMVGATVDVLTIANIQVANAFLAQTGENVSTVDIFNLNAGGNFQLKTGAGADVVNIDNVNVNDFDVDTESGADELRIERNAAYTGTSHVLGIATILTGIGADQIRIGNAIDAANLKVFFMGAMTLDAGDGANMRNDIVGSNSFAFPPVITATGGTLTQTEAA